MENNSSKNISYVGIGRIGGRILLAIFYLVFAAILDPEKYGQLSIIIALAGTFATLSRFGLQHTLQVYAAKNKSNFSDKVNTLFLILTSAASIILIPIDIFAAALCAASSIFLMNQTYLLGLRKYKQFMINSFLKNSASIILPIILFFVLDIPGIILGLAIGNIIASSFYFKKIKIQSFIELKNNYKVLIHNFGVDSSTNLPYVIDKLLLAPLFGLFIIGVYQFNLQILLGLGVLPSILYSFLLSEESIGSSHKKIILFSIIISVILAVIGIALSPFFVNEFFPKYVEGIQSLQILIIAIIPLSISAILNAKLISKESTKIGYSAIIRIGSLLPLLAFLGQLYGLVGLSLAVLFSIIFTTIFLYFIYKKV